MTGLRPPPKRDTPSQIVTRFIFLIFMLLLVGVVVWAAVVNQQIPLVEDTPLSTVETPGSETVDGVTFNVNDRGTGPAVFLLHDVDIAGSVMLSGVVDALGEDVRTISVDLPGFGFSTRLPEQGPGHTVADMANKMAGVIEARTSGPVLLAGVGLGGEVAAEVAVTNPDLVASLVLIDVDFYGSGTWVQTVERLPFLGVAATHAFETRGTFSESTWAPHCEEDGWCPTPAQKAAREAAGGIVDTTASLHAFRNTAPASEVPSRLKDITSPTTFIWSSKGSVPEEDVERVMSAMGEASRVDVEVYQAHLESPDRIAAEIRSLLP